MTRLSTNSAVRAAVLIAVGCALSAPGAEAITITYVNAGPSDSRVFVGFNNMASGSTTSDLVADPIAYSRNDTLLGPAVPPFDALAYSGAELGTNLNAPLGTGTRSVFTPFNPTFFRAHGETTLAGTGSYSAHAFAHSGNTTSTTPTSWIVHVDPSGAETPGTPTDVTISASIAGYVEILGGPAAADASWNVATTTHGAVMTGSSSQAAPGNTPFSDAGLLTFTIPLGSTFELLVDFDLSTSGSGAGVNSTSEVTAALVEISAALAPPMIFLPVSGAKLLMIDKYAASSKAKVVLLLADATPGSIAKGPAADPPQLSGTLEIFPLADPSNRAVYDLDTAGWIANKDKIAKFKNSSAGPGAAGVRVASVKPDKHLKVVAMNLGDGDAATGDQDANDIDLGALTTGDSVIVVVSIENGTDSSSYRMCAQFDAPSIKPIAGGSGIKYRSKTSSLPGACPP